MIDFIAILLLVLAIWKGAHKGFIVAVFSFLSIFAGIAAAMKFSIFASNWLLQNTSISAHLIPFLSFLFIMIFVGLLVRWAAAIIQKFVEMAMMGWLNRLGGIIFFVFLYGLLYSIVLFYLAGSGVIESETLATSVSYKLLAPVGPAAVELIGNVVPFFKGMFEELKNFFDKIPVETLV